jgi:hypothetical protein
MPEKRKDFEYWIIRVAGIVFLILLIIKMLIFEVKSW